MKKKLRNSVALGVVLLSMVACTGKTSTSESACGNNGQCSEQCKNECNQNNCKNKKEMTYSKKYTNADFYKDGKFQIAEEQPGNQLDIQKAAAEQK